MNALKNAISKIWIKICDGAKAVRNAFANFVARNATVIKETAPIWVPLTALFIKKEMHKANRRKEEREEECYHWDNKACERFKSRRPLKEHEKRKMMEYVNKGLNKGEALKRMHLNER